MTDESLFTAALAIGSPTDRAAFLDRACADKPGLRQELESLIAAHGASNPLDRPPADLGRTGAYADSSDAAGPSASVGDRVGPYKLLERIGEGGMGEVWVADQLEPIKRRVALKLIKPGMDSRSVLARFEAERQALAMMDHPNIAKVLDAGATSDGLPFFVMELVKGTPVTEFCDTRKLTAKERLELFVPVCQAIQHAHQKGVIHRDIKPTNILVALHDETPVPKVIDFGIAKAIGHQLTEKTIYTNFGALIGTPAYMAPEQATFNQLDVDTRSDVYALGVLLYELLVGSPPVEPARLKKAALEEVLRIVREEEPLRPSQRLSTLQSRATIAASRQSDPTKLSQLMRGELDWIVMKALEKDRRRRYETANGLAKDVQRYLNGEAVEACPPTLGYRLRKTYRRNRVATWVIAFVLLLTYLGITGIYLGYQRAVRAEALAAEGRDAADENRLSAIMAQEAAARERDNVARANLNLRQLATEQRRTLYATSMNLAQVAWEEGSPSRTFELLRQWIPNPGEEDLRGFEWHYWNRLAHLDLKTVQLNGFTGVNAELSPPTLSPDGTRVAAFVNDPTDQSTSLKMWEADSGRELWSVQAPAGECLQGFSSFSQDGRRFLASRLTVQNREDIQERRHQDRVWDVATGKLLYTSPSPGETINARSINARSILTPDGTLLARLINFRSGTSFSGEISVVRLSDGNEIFHFSPSPSQYPLRCVFSPNGKHFAAIIGDPQLRTLGSMLVWDMESGHEVWKANLTEKSYPMDLRYSPDGAQFIIRFGDEQDDRIAVRSCKNYEKLKEMKLPMPPGWRLAQPPIVVGQQNLVAVPQGSQVYLFNADIKAPISGEPTSQAFRGHTHTVSSVALTQNSTRLVSLDVGGCVKHWDVSSLKRKLETPFGSLITRGTIFPSPDGSRICFIPYPTDPIRRFRITDSVGKIIRETFLPVGHLDLADFSADSRTFALLWHDQQLNYTLYLWDAVNGKELRQLHPPPNVRGGVSLSPDGSMVAVTTTSSPNGGGWSSSTLDVWETNTGRSLLSRQGIRSEDNFLGDFSTDGRSLVISSGVAAKGDIQLVWFDTQSWREIAKLQLGNRSINGGGGSRDGKRIFLGQRVGETSTVRVWDVEAILRGETPEPVLTLTGLIGDIRQVHFSPDGRRILTTGDSGVKLWDVFSGREVLTLKENGVKVTAAYFSPDGNSIWGGLDENGRLWGWNGTPIAEARKP